MRIGIDLGGTKIELIALEAKQVRYQKRTATPAHDYDALLAAVVELIEGAERELGERCSVGIGMPGAVSLHTGCIKNANTQCLNGRPLQRDLERLLCRVLRLQNDANCFALSEAVDGAAAGAQVVFGAILGTGTGGGVVVRGQLITGHNAIAGEWGHNPLPWPTDAERPGPACYCGRSGCIETFLAGPSLSRDHEQACGKHLPAHEIAALAAAADPDATATLARYHDRCARALASCINLLDPDVIVLGGGLSLIPSLYDEIPKRWGRYVFSDTVSTQLLPAAHGDASGVRGAAWLWP